MSSLNNLPEIKPTPAPWTATRVRLEECTLYSDGTWPYEWHVSGPGWEELAIVHENEDPNLRTQGQENAKLIVTLRNKLDKLEKENQVLKNKLKYFLN